MKMDRTIQRILRETPRSNENPAALAKLDGYKRPIISSLAANVDRFGYERKLVPIESLSEILAEGEKEDENES